MTTKKKYYVVWNGKLPGIYNSWSLCKEQVSGFQEAKYKSFESEEEAISAYNAGYYQYYKDHPVSRVQPSRNLFNSTDSLPEMNSLSVDAAWNSVTKVMEYQGVYTATREVWFRQGPYPHATNNIGEFLAIVHGLALLKQKQINIPIYSDSITAIAWVRHKKHKSVMLPTDDNEKIFDLLVRAEYWLNNNSFTTPIIKWNTKEWGEIPADFGRK